jgi:hypothetical protein
MATQADRIFANQQFLGIVQFSGTVIFPAACIGDDQIEADAFIAATKLEHQHLERYSQPNTTTTSETRIIHEANGAGVLIEFNAGNISHCLTTATITVDVLKNGVSVLTSVLTLDNTNTNRVSESAAIAGGSNSYVDGDVFEIVIVASASGGTIGTGFFCSGVFREAAE